MKLQVKGQHLNQFGVAVNADPEQLEVFVFSSLLLDAGMALTSPWISMWLAASLIQELTGHSGQIHFKDIANESPEVVG